MTTISIEDLLYIVAAYKVTSISAIARAMGISPQNLHKKIYRNTLKKEELCKIGKILGGEYVSYFAFPGGITFGDKMKKKKGKGPSKAL